jgi:hypothetical protein
VDIFFFFIVVVARFPFSPHTTPIPNPINVPHNQPIIIDHFSPRALFSYFLPAAKRQSKAF